MKVNIRSHAIFAHPILLASEYRDSVILFQFPLFIISNVVTVYVMLFSFDSLSTLLLQVSLGHPMFLFPFGLYQVLGNVQLIHFHFLPFIFLFIAPRFAVLLHNSTFVIRLGQYILITLLSYFLTEYPEFSFIIHFTRFPNIC